MKGALIQKGRGVVKYLKQNVISNQSGLLLLGSSGRDVWSKSSLKKQKLKQLERCSNCLGRDLQATLLPTDG